MSPKPAPVPCPVQVDRPWRRLAGAAAPTPAELAAGSWTRLKRYPDRAAYRVDLAGGSVFAKHYCPRPLVGRWRDFVLRRRPQRAYRLGQRLPACGVATPRPLLLLGWGRPLLREVLLVNPWVPDCRKWSEHLHERVPKGERPAGFRRGLLDVADLLGRLHRSGLYHGDLVANLLFGEVEGEPRPLLVDLEAIQCRRARHRRHKNLWELARTAQHIGGLSPRDHWRFLVMYADSFGDDLESARRTWRQLSRAQQQRRRRGA